MLSKAEIARYLSKETNTTMGELVQFFHSNYYKDGLSEVEYLNFYNQFVIELDEFLLSLKNPNVNNDFFSPKKRKK